jgi:hypothetical protein
MLALAPILLQAAPFLANLFFGDKTGSAVQKAADIAGGLFGIDGNDPDALKMALAKADPAKMLELQTALAKFAHEQEMAKLAAEQANKQRDHDEILKRLADVQGARGMYGEARSVTDKLALVTVAAFFIINTLMIYGYYTVLTDGMKIINIEVALAVANAVGMLAGFINAKTDAVYGFFFGSSVSARANSIASASAINDVAKSFSLSNAQAAPDERARLLEEAKRLGLNVPPDMPLEGLRAAVERARK